MASQEVALRDKQLEESIAKITARLKKIDKSDRKAQELDELEEQCKDCETTMEMMRMEFRSLGPDDKVKYRERIKSHKANLKQLRNDIEWAKSSNVKQELVGDRKDKLQDLDLDSAGGLMSYGRNLQAESIASLQRTVGVVGDTQQIGRDVAIKVQAQTEQIKKMYDDLYEIDDMLLRSRKIITRMLKKTASSKTVWILVACVVIGIGLIIYFKVRP